MRRRQKDYADATLIERLPAKWLDHQPSRSVAIRKLRMHIRQLNRGTILIARSSEECRRASTQTRMMQQQARQLCPA